MPYKPFCYQRRRIGVFIILITIFLIQACVSSPYHQKSPQKFSGKIPLTHKVSTGDTLFSIAWRYGLKYQELAKYNGISVPYKIYPGQVVRLNITKKFSTTKQTSSNLLQRSKLDTSASYSKNNSSKNQSNTSGKPAKSLLQNGSVTWHWPVKGTILQRFSGAQTLSKGIDIGGNLGEPVLAAASGQVVYAGSGLRGYGKLLILRHSDSFLSAYAHNHKLLVKEGDSVKAGQKIADMGSSGTDRVKLHFEIRRDGSPEDPLKYLPRR